ncbi:Chitin synthase, class 7 [Basidiobolus ranarum]|uniref:Chitin synthase export chaperone n=1 Tax=Basidiobolus ranarum TaxID=34480 RepID=A0ABR2WR06_9FUNG
MIYHIKTKYTAVGRKEMVIFFYLYLVTLVVDSVVSSGLVPSNTTAYLHLTSSHFALISAGIWCLLGNGFVGFQFAEDGTPMSIWTLRLSSLVVFASTYFLCYGTFTNLVSFLDPVKPTLLWVGFFGFNAGALIIYLILQVILITNTLSDLWPLGDIIIGSLFFIAGQLGMLFSSSICTIMNHYLDGQFVASVFTLLTVMMIYKYWDSITKEDLEFHVGGKIHPWERLSKSSIAPPHRMSTRGAIL